MTQNQLIDTNPDGTFTQIHRGISALPVVDGVLYKEPFLDLLKQGVGSHIKCIIGSNREENGFRPASVELPGSQEPLPLTYGGYVRDYEDILERCSRELMGL